MAGVKDLAAWAKEAGARWPEPFLFLSLFPTVMALCADKAKPVSIEATNAAKALVSCMSPHAMEFVLPMILAEADG